MSDTIKDMWPEIDVTVISPIAVLKFQASQLRDKTRGLLEGNVNPWKAKDGDQVYDFQIIAPALERYTYALFKAWHKPDFVYPVTVRFEPWMEAADAERRSNLALSVVNAFGGNKAPSGLRTPSSPKEFLEVLGSLLGSSHTKGVLSSLIARINDAKEQQPSTPLYGGQDTLPPQGTADADAPKSDT